jgi:hypothetical protein
MGGGLSSGNFPESSSTNNYPSGTGGYAWSSVGKNFLVYRMKTRSTVIITINPTQKAGRN